MVAAAIEGQKDNFINGWPELGINPIDPFYLDEYYIQYGEGATS